MKKSLTLVLALVIFLFCFKVSLAQDQDRPKTVWIDSGRYQIVLLKSNSTEWPATFNEVILLDRQEGRTWILKSKNLQDGWVPMPREDTQKKQ